MLLLLRKSPRLAAKAAKAAKAENATVIATGTSAGSPKLLKTPSPNTKKTNTEKEPSKEKELTVAFVQALRDEEMAKQAKEKAEREAIRLDVSANKRGIASCKNAIKTLFGIFHNEKREREKLEDAVNDVLDKQDDIIADQGRHLVVTNDMVKIQQATLLTVNQILCAFAVFIYVAFFIGMKVVGAFGDDAFVVFNIVTAVGFVGIALWAVFRILLWFGKKAAKLFGWE